MFFGNARWAACPQKYRGKEVNTRASPTFCLGFYSPRLRRMREFPRILLFLGVSGHQTRVEYRYAICEARYGYRGGGVDASRASRGERFWIEGLNACLILKPLLICYVVLFRTGRPTLRVASLSIKTATEEKGG